MITTNNKKGNKRSRFEEFKAKLMAYPKSVLKENGVDAAEALEVGIDENFKLLFSGRIIDNEKERRIEQG